MQRSLKGQDLSKYLNPIIGTKSINWSEENEFRLIYPADTDEPSLRVSFNAESIKSIIVGEFANDVHRERLIRIASSLDVPFRTAYLRSNLYGVEIR